MRSFAKSLSISSSTLTEILSGKRSISEKMKWRLGENLRLTHKEISKFDHAPSKSKPVIFKSSRPVLEIDQDIFAIISDWYHYAILELTRVDGFQSSVEYISHALEIDKAEAQVAVERLFKLKFLEVDEDGRWFDATDEEGLLTNIQDKVTSVASKKMQKQILELSIKTLMSKSLEERNHTAMTMALDIGDLPKAMEKIKEFRRSLANELSKISRPTHVYHMHIGLYPVSRRTN
jgi:uncharacterized protein (TIGR02147 family)